MHPVYLRCTSGVLSAKGRRIGRFRPKRTRSLRFGEGVTPPECLSSRHILSSPDTPQGGQRPQTTDWNAKYTLMLHLPHVNSAHPVGLHLHGLLSRVAKRRWTPIAGQKRATPVANRSPHRIGARHCVGTDLGPPSQRSAFLLPSRLRVVRTQVSQGLTLGAPLVVLPSMALETGADPGILLTAMPLLRLNRINKGGEILINSEQILFIEIESKVTTVHLTDRQLFSVEESPTVIAERIEAAHTARFANANQQHLDDREVGHPSNCWSTAEAPVADRAFPPPHESSRAGSGAPDSAAACPCDGWPSTGPKSSSAVQPRDAAAGLGQALFGLRRHSWRLNRAPLRVSGRPRRRWHVRCLRHLTRFVV